MGLIEQLKNSPRALRFLDAIHVKNSREEEERFYTAYLVEKAEELGVRPAEVVRQYEPKRYLQAQEHRSTCENWCNCPRKQLVEAEAFYEFRRWKESNMSTEERIEWAESLDKEVWKALRMYTIEVNMNDISSSVVNPKLWVQSSPDMLHFLKWAKETNYFER